MPRTVSGTENTSYNEMQTLWWIAHRGIKDGRNAVWVHLRVLWDSQHLLGAWKMSVGEWRRESHWVLYFLAPYFRYSIYSFDKFFFFLNSFDRYQGEQFKWIKI